ncbi:RING finger protein 225 [Paramormyrops kingsleyae]|uniref:RING finger protein 225 n=1 Tax=Paramormyrops kingsleyae TaxID=1676925 RepID=UPI000CD5DF91|nr:RING finger protein 223-like [Paramormyrops kingsleyae]
MESKDDPESMTVPPEGIPDLECAICYSQFNNVFRTPKKLQCKHTFCLECLARMNVKSSQPDTIQCPFCRALTPLPTLGLPKLDNDTSIMSNLPEAMQHVYSIRFIRSKARLQVKHPQRVVPLPQLRTVSSSLDVGPPSTTSQTGSHETGTRHRLPCMPPCKMFIMVVVVLLIVSFICIIIIMTKTS